MEKSESEDHAGSGNREEGNQSQSQDEGEKLVNDIFNNREKLEEAQTSFNLTAGNKSKPSSDGSAETIGTDTLDATQTIEIGVANIQRRSRPGAYQQQPSVIEGAAALQVATTKTIDKEVETIRTAIDAQSGGSSTDTSNNTGLEKKRHIGATGKTVENDVPNLFVARENIQLANTAEAQPEGAASGAAGNNSDHIALVQPGAYAMGGVPEPTLTEENNRIEQDEEDRGEGHVANAPWDITGSATFGPSQTQAPEPPASTRLQRGRNVQTNLEPGAYAAAGVNSHQNEPEASNVGEVRTIPSSAGDNGVQPFGGQEGGLVEARAVDDEDPEQVLTEARAVEPKSRNHELVPYRPLGVGLLLVAALCTVVGLFVGIKNNGVPSSEEATAMPTVPPTALPTVFTTRGFILQTVLPDTTARAAIGDGNSNTTASPQSQALRWTLQDPSLETYLQDHQRFLQRFALATFYYSTNGNVTWGNNDKWLDYNHHECHWFAKNDIAFAQPDDQITYLQGYDEMVNKNPCELPPNVTVPTTATLTTESSFKHLWMYTNRLDGTFPMEISFLQSLRSISTYVNPKLRGSIPTEIGVLTNLEFIALPFSSHTGTLPTELGLLTKLLFLVISNNAFTGSIPSELGLLNVSLMTLMLDQNMFTGTIPEELYNITYLRTLYISEIPLEGTLSTKIGQLTNMWDFQADLLANGLSGTIPSEIGKLHMLKRFVAYNTDFTGTICTEVGLLTNRLRVLDLHSNFLNGPIPSELGLLSTATQVFFDDNMLTGTIPTEINGDNLPELFAWDVRGNEGLVINSDSDNVTNFDVFPEELGGCWINMTFIDLDCPVMLITSNASIRCDLCKCSCAPRNEVAVP
ncbi:Leucine Rich Repeat [Seminavis robusta]|uniref:Leucine Rich Repeat n=1 Tax=Seminavis robusta TaxID=568900 RepID=A0A9N8EUI8_9STRA|nr:Leucine Rich Repeat [Seminavis robusta]|eukprot:Sro1919_g305430.1 Leucine Rich Repeat (861) ;mRNA; f:910-3567